MLTNKSEVCNDHFIVTKIERFIYEFELQPDKTKKITKCEVIHMPKEVPLEELAKLNKEALNAKIPLSQVYKEIKEEPLFNYDFGRIRDELKEELRGETDPLEQILTGDINLDKNNDCYMVHKFGLNLLVKLSNIAKKYKVEEEKVYSLYFSRTLRLMEEAIRKSREEDAKKYANYSLYFSRTLRLMEEAMRKSREEDAKKYARIVFFAFDNVNGVPNKEGKGLFELIGEIILRSSRRLRDIYEKEHNFEALEYARALQYIVDKEIEVRKEGYKNDAISQAYFTKRPFEKEKIPFLYGVDKK